MSVSDIESTVAGVGDNSYFVPAINEKIREPIASEIGAFDVKDYGAIRPFRTGKLSVHGGRHHKTAEKQKSQGDTHSYGCSGGSKEFPQLGRDLESRQEQNGCVQGCLRIINTGNYLHFLQTRMYVAF